MGPNDPVAANATSKHTLLPNRANMLELANVYSDHEQGEVAARAFYLAFESAEVLTRFREEVHKVGGEGSGVFRCMCLRLFCVSLCVFCAVYMCVCECSLRFVC